MSLPNFPNPNEIPTMEQAFAAIITSIAMEESSLSHVIKAESEKIKFVVECAKEKGCGESHIKDLLDINKSASETLKSIVVLEEILKEKFETAVKHMPSPTCVPKFVTQAGYIWLKNGALFLMEKGRCEAESKPCNNGVHLVRRNCESMILLPRGKKFEILFELHAINKNHCPAKVAIEFRIGKEIVKTETIEQSGEKIKISHSIPFKSPIGESDAGMIFRLLSPEKLSCVVGVVTIFMKT